MKGRKSTHAPQLTATAALTAAPLALLVVALALASPPFVCAARAAAQGDAGVAGASGAEDEERSDDISRESFAEVREMKRVLLVATKSLTADARGPAREVLEEVFERPEGSVRRHEYAYSIIGKRLNRYIRRHRSITAVESLAEADFVIVFKVLNEQPSFIASEPHVYGEMFVILNRAPTRPRPVVVWWTKHNQTTLEDAVDDFLKDLRELRGEK